jgi:hypothetical protein
MFEEAVLMIILQMFGGEPRALSDAFHTDQPWGSRKVVLVSLKRRADGEMYSCPVSWTSGSSDRLGFKATSPTQVIEFLNNPDGKCFLFPDTHMGPDLSWFFQDWETKELIFANGQGKLSETLTPANCSVPYRPLTMISSIRSKCVRTYISMPSLILYFILEEERRPCAICPVKVP